LNLPDKWNVVAGDNNDASSVIPTSESLKLFGNGETREKGDSGTKQMNESS
jgi:hypothetical protein